MTKLKPELSKRSRYWISKHRYYELKHFCLQYREWRSMYLSLPESRNGRFDQNEPSQIEWADGTARAVFKRDYYLKRMRMVEDTAKMTDRTIAKYLFKGVTEDVGYTYLKSVMEIPCGRDMYYDRYRRFFWILDHRLREQYQS